MALQEVGGGGMDRIDLAQERDRCLGLVNAVIKFKLHKILEFFDSLRTC
jgi:hypothetical protein